MTCTINQLPLEVLGEIFLHCLPTPIQSDAAAPYPRIPQSLTCVCKLWHNLTPTLPALWASLHIKCDSYSVCPPLHVIDTHIQRSGTRPFTFSLHARSIKHRNSHLTPFLPNVLTALATARERWQSVFITLTTAPQRTIDAIAQGPAPLLRTFHCELIEPTELQPLSIPLHALQMCPQLESLVWAGFHNTPPHYPMVDPTPLHHILGDTAWSHLIFLRLGASISAADCLALLRLSPRLATAELGRIVRISSSSTHPLLQITHNTLCTLHAKGPHSTAFLHALTLPALAHLHLDARPFSICSGRKRTGLHAFLARSASPLRTLTLNFVRYSEPDLLRTLALAPALYSLSFTDNIVRLTPAFIRALHPAPGNVALCPLLRTLHLSRIKCADGACGAMLRARWGEDALANGVAALERVHIDFYGHMQRADRETMRVLSDAGMAGELGDSPGIGRDV
ncbi:hypothetical protein BD779DRAFT_1788062 [Infundibulicybe gibba]|nr:hypothetical protein BD779DRAFT_1788062 [Infundibulicybe gibba]